MHGSLEAWLVAPQSGREGERSWRMIQRGAFVRMFTELNPTFPLCPLMATSRPGRTGRGLKGEVESVVNMWLQAAIPRPASPPPHHLSVRIIEQHIMCSGCAVLSCSSRCYHPQGQRFNYSVRRTRKTLNWLWRSNSNTQTPAGTDFSPVKVTFLLVFTQEENVCDMFAQMWQWGQIFNRKILLNWILMRTLIFTSNTADCCLKGEDLQTELWFYP